MQMYHTLVDSIIKTNDLEAYNKLYSLLNNPQHITTIFNNLEGNQDLLFVGCEVFGKRLINREFALKEHQLSSSDEEENIDKDLRKKILCDVVRILYAIVLNATTLKKSTINSCLNTISAAIKIVLISHNTFDPVFMEFLTILQPYFTPTLHNSQSYHTLIFIPPSSNPLSLHHKWTVRIFISILQFVTNSAYFDNYYYYRRNTYFFRNHYLPYFLDYAIYSIKTATKSNNEQQFQNNVLHQTFHLLEMVVMYPFNLSLHEAQIDDEVHDNISGSQSEIYFPAYFRLYLCDFEFLEIIVRYYKTLTQPQSMYIVIRILARTLSSSEYVFNTDVERGEFRNKSIQLVIEILQHYCNSNINSSYIILCFTKLNIKILQSFNNYDYATFKFKYFQTVIQLIRKIVKFGQIKIEDADKNPIRQAFDLLKALMNCNYMEPPGVMNKYGQEILELVFCRLVDNEENEKRIKQFGFNNDLEIECFQAMFQIIPEIFTLNLPLNLEYLSKIDFATLNKSSKIFWLHLTSKLLPHYNTSKQQSKLVIKFFHLAISPELKLTLASLHYINILTSEILVQIENGVSTTYLWNFIQNQLKMNFDMFLVQLLNYTIDIFQYNNYNLLQNGLELFKTIFTKLCYKQHASYVKYFNIVLSININQTYLGHPDFIKLRVLYFNIFSTIWIKKGDIMKIYKILHQIKQPLYQESFSVVNFMRYLTDLTGIVNPIESCETFKLIVELILIDMGKFLPKYLGNQQQVRAIFEEETYVRIFVKFLLALTNDDFFRLEYHTQTNIPLLLFQTFQPYMTEIVKYQYPKKTIQLYLKFIKLNPLATLLPLCKSFKEKNSPLYKGLLREYFENLHRLQTLDEFYHVYYFIEDNIQFMIDWWDEIMNRGYQPDVNIRIFVQARLWATMRQKQNLGKLLYRIWLYNPVYWTVDVEMINEYKYGQWFTANYK